jgi:hypothetical protein
VKATTITYVNPAVAIVAGVVALNERITVWTIAGFVLVLAGSYLVTLRRRQDVVVAAGPEEVAAAAEHGASPSGERSPRSAETGSP